MRGSAAVRPWQLQGQLQVVLEAADEHGSLASALDWPRAGHVCESGDNPDSNGQHCSARSGRIEHADVHCRP